MVDRFKLNIGQMTSAISVLSTDESCGKFFKRLITYVQGTNIASTDAIVEAVFQLAKVGIDEEKLKSAEISEKRRVAGALGGAPNGNHNARKQANSSKTSNCLQKVDLLEKEIEQANGCLYVVDNKAITDANKQNKHLQKSESHNIYYSIDNTNISNINNKDIDILSTTDDNILCTSTEKIDLRELAKFFNRLMEGRGIPQIKNISGKRKLAVNARFREHGKQGIAKAIQLASESKFLNGETADCWVASFDWIFKPNNFVKVLEGNYNNRPEPNKQIGTSYKERPSSGAGKTLNALINLIGNGTNTSDTATTEGSEYNRTATIADCCSRILSEKSAD